MNIFLVDDDPMMVKLQAKILSNGGHAVSSEVDSNLAMEQIKSRHPDCVITDLMMPGVDGYELISLIRNDSELDNVVIIVLSAKMFPQDQRQAMDLGANGFILKPINPTTYLDQVTDILDTV